MGEHTRRVAQVIYFARNVGLLGSDTGIDTVFGVLPLRRFELEKARQKIFVVNTTACRSYAFYVFGLSFH